MDSPRRSWRTLQLQKAEIPRSGAGDFCSAPSTPSCLVVDAELGQEAVVEFPAPPKRDLPMTVVRVVIVGLASANIYGALDPFSAFGDLPDVVRHHQAGVGAWCAGRLIRYSTAS